MFSSLTPIKIRGKNWGKGKKPDWAKSKKPVSLPNPKFKGKHGHIPESADIPESPLPKSAKRKRSHRATSGLKPNQKAPKHASVLENLPAELLENIFFNCLNVSLPQASPLIGKKLASNHVKTQLTYIVLSSPSRIEHTYLLDNVFPTVQEQADAQSAILRLKWMTLPFLRDLIPDYITKILVQQLGKRKLPWIEGGPVVSSACEPLIRQYLEENRYRLEGKDGFRELPAYWELRWPWLRTQGGPCSDDVSHRLGDCDCLSALHVGISLSDGLVTLGLSDGPFILGILDSHVQGITSDRFRSISGWSIFSSKEGCRIPGKLLHGPWTNEKCEFLALAARGNAEIDWVRSTSGEVAKEGLLQAIEDCNVRAVRALVLRTKLYDSYRTHYYATKEARAADERMVPSMFQQIPIREGVGVYPTNEHLRKAITTPGCSLEIFVVLLQAAEQSDETYDSALISRVEQLSGSKYCGKLKHRIMQTTSI